MIVLRPTHCDSYQFLVFLLHKEKKHVFQNCAELKKKCLLTQKFGVNEKAVCLTEDVGLMTEALVSSAIEPSATEMPFTRHATKNSPAV